MKEFFSQVSCNSDPCSYGGPVDTVEIEKVISLHPLKNPADLRRTHVAYLRNRLQKISQRRLKLKGMLENIETLLRLTDQTNTHNKRMKREKLFTGYANVQPWESLDHSKIWALYKNAPLRYIHYSTDVAMQKIVGTVKESILRKNELASFHNLNIGKYHKGYMRMRPSTGMEFVFNVPVKYQTRHDNKVQVTQANHVIHATQKFGEPTYKFLENSNEKTTLNFILPLVGRPEMFRLFLASFEKEFLIPKESVRLLVIYFPDAQPSEDQKKAFDSYAAKYPFALTWVDFRGPFMKAAALQLGVNYFSNESLVVTCDVDVVFRREFATRCREMTSKGRSVYFPVVFSEFNPNVTYAGKKPPGTHYYYVKEAGLWRIFGFGLCCAYAEDIHRSGGLKTELVGWGMEDVDLYDKFVSNKEMEIFRAPDPGLVHVYHPHVACASDTSKNLLSMCLSAQSDRYVSSGAVIDYYEYKGYLNEL